MLMLPITLTTHCIHQMSMCSNEPHSLLHQLAIFPTHAKHAKARSSFEIVLPKIKNLRLLMATGCSWVLCHRMTMPSPLTLKDVLGQLEEGTIGFLELCKTIRVMLIVAVLLQDRPWRTWKLHHGQSGIPFIKLPHEPSTAHSLTKVYSISDIYRLHDTKTPCIAASKRNHRSATEDLDQVIVELPARPF